MPRPADRESSVLTFPPRSEWSAEGKPVPIATKIKLAGKTWDLYKGPNNQMTVFSFLPSNGKNINGFKGDVNEFLKYLTKSQGMSATQYLKSVGKSRYEPP